MRAWCVVVPMEKGEEVRRTLRDQKLLLKHLRIESDGPRLRIPTVRQVEMGYPTEEWDFAEGFVPVPSYKSLVRIPDRLRTLLPTAFDVVGDIAILRIPDELEDYGEEIGRALLAGNRKVHVVARDRGVSGEHRIRRLEILAGEARTTTVHVEFGLRYHVDVARAYFSPRLGTERMRVAEQTGAGEVVADPFAGVGPYSILIARRRSPERVVASDANSDAVDLLRRNVSANRAERVLVREGDARAVLREAAPVDRVILDLPHSALDFLPEALAAVGREGTVHLYGILAAADRPDRVEEIRRRAGEAGRHLAGIRVHEVRAYSPSQHHVAFDVTVGPG